jgi:hypothetical protein
VIARLTPILHFVYAVHPTRADRVCRKFMHAAYRYGFNGGYISQRSEVDTSEWPFRAPVSITKHVYDALRSKFDVRLYDLRERVVIPGGENHVLIGHPCPGQDNAVWNASCLKGKFAARIAMMPLHHGLAEVNAPFDPFVNLVDRILAITGPYWFDTWEQSALAHWKSKMTRVDMAIDTKLYPRIKRRFNKKGQRKFLHIGWDGACKGTHLLRILFRMAENQRCIWIGGPATGVANITSPPGGELNPEFMQPILDECDFLIVPSVSDANPTTILEAMAWGIPVCCTPQAGYYNMPELFSLSTTDMRHNLDLMNSLQNADEDQLLLVAEQARQKVERQYTWDRLVGTVLGEIENVLIAKGILPGEAKEGVAVLCR